MFVSIFSEKNTALHGVDISSSSIKLIELSKSGNKYKVENYVTRPLPENAVVEKNINELEAVGDVIVKMASVLKTKTKYAAATEGLAAQVEEVISCKTVVANPFAKMSIGSRINKAQLKNDASSLLMACGLAARGFMS